MAILANGTNNIPFHKCSDAAQDVGITLLESKAVIKEGKLDDFLLLDIAKMIQREKFNKAFVDILEKAFVAYNDDDPSALEKLCMVVESLWGEMNTINMEKNG